MGVNTSTVLSDSAVEIMNQAVIISGNSVNRVDAFATIKDEATAKAIAFTVYSRMGKATTPLTENTEAVSESMQDNQILLTMSEYGNVVSTTSLANITTGGKADLAAARLVGINSGETTDTLGINVLMAGTQTVAAVTTDTLSAADLRTAYNQLATAGIAKFGDGRYVAMVNPTQTSDIKDAFIEIVKNTNAVAALNGQVGALEGFTIIEDSNVPSGKVACFGMNALGLGVAKPVALVIKDGNDNLNRLMNLGWYGVLKYGVIDDNALRVITGA